MTAAEHRIVIEKGADFTMKIHVTQGIAGTEDKDLSGYKVYMRLMTMEVEDKKKTIKYAQASNDELSAKANTYLVNGQQLTGTNGENGEISLTVDKAVTAKLKTLIDTEGDVSLFATEYNYFYTVDIRDERTNGTEEDIRILRGKCAVRE